MKKHFKYATLSTLVCAVLNIGIANAGPADYLYTPKVIEGEKEIDFKFGTAKQADGTRKTVSMLGAGYSPTNYWLTEVYLTRELGAEGNLTIAEWENKFQLTDSGKYFVDVGAVTEIEAPLNNHKEPWELKVGALFQKTIGKVKLNGNVLLERKVGGETEERFATQLGYQWQAKYKLQPSFEVGLQGFGDVGEWNNWSNQSEQSHRAGPVIYTEFNLGGKQAIKCNAAVLFRLNQGAPDHTFRLQAEYEF